MREAPVAVVIPSLNEAAHIRSAIESAHDAGADRIIVSDGGSGDDTVAIARDAGATVVAGGRPLRGDQLNRGAAMAADHTVCFLHADTTLPVEACEDIRRALGSGARFGGFTIRFSEDYARLRFVAAMINARARLTGMIWGDQAQFFDRELFERLGGYPLMPLMEDYEMIRRARVAGRPCLISRSVTTSGRRFLERGVVRTTLTNWSIVARYHAGVSPEVLAERYRRRRRD